MHFEDEKSSFSAGVYYTVLIGKSEERSSLWEFGVDSIETNLKKRAWWYGMESTDSGSNDRFLWC
jgi:hypothetical protein